MMLADSVATDIFRGLLQGTPPGSVYALIAVGFVLTYKTSGVFNLAFGAQAYVSAAMYFQARVEWEWDTIPAFVLSVLVLAPLLGLTLEWLIFRHLRTAPAISKLVVTIGLSVAIPALFDIISGFEAVAGQTPVGIAPDGAQVFYDPFGVYPFSRDELVAMGIVVGATVVLGAVLNYSAIGLRTRAVVESPRMTELSGIAADRVSAIAWMLSSLFAGLAGVLIAPRFNTLAAADFFDLVVVAIAAAAIGRLVSLPRALLGGLGLGMLIALLNTFLPRWSQEHSWLQPLQENLTPALPFIILFGVLVFVPAIRNAKEVSDPLADVDPPVENSSPTARNIRMARIGAGVGLVLSGFLVGIVYFEADTLWLLLVSRAVVLATIFLSITVVIGMAGQVSLCQGAFAATGAYAVYQLVDRYDMSVVVASVVGGVIAAVLAALLSLPIRRLGGVWTAIATLAFAYFFDSVIVNLSWVGGGDAASFGAIDIPRPVIGPWDLGGDDSFFLFAVAVFIVVAVVVAQLRVGTLGRVLSATRSSEVGAASIGVSPAKARLVAFALSGFIAGLGGGMLAMLEGDVNYGTNFSPYVALFWVVVVVVIGVRTVTGALLAAASYALFDTVFLKGELLGWILRSPERIPDVFPISSKWLVVLFGLGAIGYARHPEGIVEQVRRSIDAFTARRGDPSPAVAMAGSPPPGGASVAPATSSAAASAASVDDGAPAGEVEP